tara:strand:+ start:3581 stop:3817 length:237 start_codon:yes stop_codon:yes gene_type:complete
MYKSGKVEFPKKCPCCGSKFLVKEMLKYKKPLIQRKYTSEEINLIKKQKTLKDLRKLAKKLGRTKYGIQIKYYRLKIK